MSRVMIALRAVPILPRLLVIGAAVAGIFGTIAGLILGLRAYPRTAWFAVFEVGIPASIAGGLVGVAVGALITVRRELRR